MNDPVATAEKEILRAVQQLERLVRRLGPIESRLEALGGREDRSQASELAGLLGSVLVDRLHPAIEALRSAVPLEHPDAPKGPSGEGTERDADD